MISRFQFRMPPAATALLLQLTALVLSALLIRFAALQFTPLNIAISTGVIATLLSLFARMARWWLLIQLIFTPTLVFMLALALPPAVYLVAFILFALVYWNTFDSQVPLYLSSRRVWHTLEEVLPPAQKDHRFSFIDIGCGTAGVLTHLARKRPDGDFVGIENAPLPYLISRLRIKLLNVRNCRIILGSFWEHHLAQHDVVYAFLSPVPMPKLWAKARAEMKPGSLLVSNTFEIPGEPPDCSITLDDYRQSTLFLWHTPSSKP